MIDLSFTPNCVLTTLHYSVPPFTYRLGAVVEVAGATEDMIGSFYEATIMQNPFPNIYTVEYFNLTDVDRRTRLQEVVERHRIRTPRLPVADATYFVGLLVDAWRRGGWWQGFIIREWSSPIEYRVYFPAADETMVLPEGDIRPHSLY